MSKIGVMYESAKRTVARNSRAYSRFLKTVSIVEVDLWFWEHDDRRMSYAFFGKLPSSLSSASAANSVSCLTRTGPEKGMRGLMKNEATPTQTTAYLQGFEL